MIGSINYCQQCHTKYCAHTGKTFSNSKLNVLVFAIVFKLEGTAQIRKQVAKPFKSQNAPGTHCCVICEYPAAIYGRLLLSKHHYIYIPLINVPLLINFATVLFLK